MNRKTLIVALLAAFIASTVAVAAEEVKLETEEHKMLYALGIIAATRLPHFDLNDQEIAVISAGLLDGIQSNEPRVDMKSMAAKIEPYVVQRVQVAMESEKVAGKSFRDEAAKEAGAQVTESGLIYREVEAGTGAAPTPDDTVRILYHGELRDGSTFDRSDEPVEFSVSGVVPCFSEGLQKMKVGGKSRLICPPEMAYGDRGSPPRIRPGATLVFDIELVEIKVAEAAAP